MQGNRERAGNIGDHTIILGVLIGVITGFSLFPFLDKIFLAMGATWEPAKLPKAYGQVVIIGTPFIFLANLGNATLRGEGDTKRTMCVMILSSLMNIVLELIFIYSFSMGVVGAAVATVVSIIFSASVIM